MNTITARGTVMVSTSFTINKYDKYSFYNIIPIVASSYVSNQTTVVNAMVASEIDIDNI